MPSHRRQGGGSKQQKQTGKKSQEEEELDSILEAYQRQAETELAQRKPSAPKRNHESRPPPPTPPPGFDDRWLPNAIFPAPIFPPELLLDSISELDSPDDALYVCDLALYKDPQCSLAWYHKGILAENSRADFDAALVCYRRAIQFDQKFLEAAGCCLSTYLQLRDYDGVYSTVEEYLNLARRVSNKESRTLCLRYFLRIVVSAGTASERFSKTDGYYSDLVEIVNEYPSLEALQELGRYAHGWASWKRHSKESRGDFDSELSGEDQERIDGMVAQAEYFCDQADRIRLEDFLDEKRRERKAMDPHFKDGETDIGDGFDEDFRSRKKNNTAVRAQIESEFGNQQVGAKGLVETGEFGKAAQTYARVGDYASALKLVKQHAGSAESTPNQSRRLYFVGAVSLFTQEMHLEKADPTRSPAQVRRDRDAFFTYCEDCVAIPIEEFEVAKRWDRECTHLRPIGAVELEVHQFYAANIQRLQSKALFQVVLEGIESGCGTTVAEGFFAGLRFLDRRNADVKEKIEFLTFVVEILAEASRVRELGHHFTRQIRELKEQLPGLSDDDDDEDELEDSGSESARVAHDRLLQTDESRLRQSVRREEDHQRTDIQEFAHRALLKARWKQHVERKRASQTSTKAGPPSTSPEVPVCKVTAVQRREMRVLLESPAVDERAAVTVLDDEILPQRAVLFPRAVASDAVLTFTHALRPLHLHVHEIAAQLFNLSEGSGGGGPGGEARSVTVLRRGKAATQTIVDVLSSVIAACDRGYCSRSSGLKSFSLPMTGVPKDVEGRGDGGDVAITEVVPSKGAALRVWGFQPGTMGSSRLRFVAKVGFHKPIGESYRFADCVAASVGVF